MDINRIENKFWACLGSDNVKQQEPMSKHTTFRIGGPADFYLCPHSTKEVQEVMEICKEENLPYFVLGNGSNLLVSDKGYRGVVIQLWKNFSDITVTDCCIQAKAGADVYKRQGYHLLALLYLKDEEYEKARKPLKTAAKIDKTNTTTLRFLKEIEEQTGRATNLESR